MYNFQEKVRELITYLQDKYETDLPAEFKPHPDCLGEFKKNRNVLEKEPKFDVFFEQAKKATITPHGFINVDMRGIIPEVEFCGLLIRESYIDLAK